MKIYYKVLFFLFLSTPLAMSSEAHEHFFYEGDGALTLHNTKNDRSITLNYKSSDGVYSNKFQEKANWLFGSDKNQEDIPLRLIALLDYIEDQYELSPIKILSAYRSPKYNAALVKRNKKASKASLHMDGMAADLKMPTAKAEIIWKELQNQDCCGVGFYHNGSLHVDAGRPRFWDENWSSKVSEDYATHNKVIFVSADKDIYKPGEGIRLSFAQVTEYPFGVKEVRFVKEGSRRSKRIFKAKNKCAVIQDRKESKNFQIQLTDKIKFNEGRLKVKFCGKPHKKMPSTVTSNRIQVLDPPSFY